MATEPANTQLKNAKTDNEIARVILWCVPRSVSTSFLKCMTQVPDSQVWYEPFFMGLCFSTYKNREAMVKFHCKVWGPKVDEEEFGSGISGGYLAKDKSYSWIKDQLEANPSNKRVIFSKDLCWGIDGHYEDLPKGFRHTFLIRHPYRVFDSWKRMVNRGITEESKKMELTEQPEFLLPKGLYFKEQYDLYMHVKETIEPNPVIIDTDDLLADPRRVVKAYCNAVGIPYSGDNLLQWKPGRECMDKLWMVAKEQILSQNVGAPHAETFASTGFRNPTKHLDRSELSSDVLYCSDLCIKYYEEMHKNRLSI